MIGAVIFAVAVGCSVTYLLTGHLTGTAVALNILAGALGVLIAMWRIMK